LQTPWRSLEPLPGVLWRLNFRGDCARAGRLRRRRQADGREQEGRVAALRSGDQSKRLRCGVEIPGSALYPAQSAPADGPEGLKAFLAYLREKFPDYHSEIKRVFADGDYVILHVHNVPTPGSRGNAIIDIFRLENGKVVEHWDVRQEIPNRPPIPTRCFSRWDTFAWTNRWPDCSAAHAKAADRAAHRMRAVIDAPK
jgi:SnoaL-like domain